MDFPGFMWVLAGSTALLALIVFYPYRSRISMEVGTPVRLPKQGKVGKIVALDGDYAVVRWGTGFETELYRQGELEPVDTGLRPSYG